MNNTNVTEILSDLIDDPSHAMRSDMDRDGLFELAENIKDNGLINPITVRPVGERYEVVAGHRRFCALKIAGIIRVPCVVRDLDDNQTFSVMAAENIERQDVDPVDEAAFISEFMTRGNLDVRELAKKLKRSVAYVESRLAVGRMPDYMQAALKAGDIKLGVALTLSEITNEEQRRHWFALAIRDGINNLQAQSWLAQSRALEMPAGFDQSGEAVDYQPCEPQELMYECRIDGKQYPARECEAIYIYKGNRHILFAIREQLNAPAMETEPAPVPVS